MRLIERLVRRENLTNAALLAEAREAIWTSWRRTCATERRVWEHQRGQLPDDEAARRHTRFDPDCLPPSTTPLPEAGASPSKRNVWG